MRPRLLPTRFECGQRLWQRRLPLSRCTILRILGRGVLVWGTYLVARRPLVSERKNMRANASRKPWAEKDSELVKEAKRLMRRSTKDAGALCATSLRSWPLGYVNEDAAQFSAPSVQSMLHKD
jgi:hypothetical protein